MVDVATGTRIAGARIAWVGTRLSARTDEKGEFTILNVPPGTYSIQAQAEGYVTGRMEGVTVEPNTLVILGVNLRKLAQTTPPVPSQPPVVSLTWDEPSEPIGGFGAIQANLRYPEEARQAGIEGKV